MQSLPLEGKAVIEGPDEADCRGLSASLHQQIARFPLRRPPRCYKPVRVYQIRACDENIAHPVKNAWMNDRPKKNFGKITGFEHKSLANPAFML